MILYHSSFVAAPDVVSRARAAFSGRLPFLRLCCALSFQWQIPRGSLVLGNPLPALVCSWVLFPALPPRLGRRVLLHPCRGSAGYLLWDLPPPYEHHHDLAFAPSSPTDFPYMRPALIFAARLDLPIRALLLRVLASHVCSALGLHMRSTRRRTGTRTLVPPSDSCISWARRWTWRWMRGVRVLAECGSAGVCL
ncbi:hypothetical protein B0H14DRAFT_549513 [Mycena olivaceomarginata]|nr:hypothetical protein B0H14DRAFT_549513 [Mycena olivaceomarginata]